ncbi:MAG: hypothetical protein H7Z13_18415 [Ferruginibacter sp.]|nr:hypothetical protein [Ferruginibacter sp.]
MNTKPSFWQRMGLHDWFLKTNHLESVSEVKNLTPNIVYKYIVDKFEESVQQLSFASRVVFYHEYIISFSQEDYHEFMDDKKGIFGIIIQESLKQFYANLKEYRLQGKTVEPAANKWVFRFASHPDYKKGDIGFIGKLLPGNQVQKEQNLRVTFIPRQTGIAQTLDINQAILKDFTFYSEGYYEVTFQEDLLFDAANITGNPIKSFGRFETTLPDLEFAGKKLEYLMRAEDIIVSGKEEDSTAANIFRIPSEWVSTPHLRIRYDKNEDKFYLASFGEKTIVNEQEIPKSDIQSPGWISLPVNSRIVLNGIVGINLFKS